MRLTALAPVRELEPVRAVAAVNVRRIDPPATENGGRTFGAFGKRVMPHTVDFDTVSTVGLDSSPVAAALAGLRAHEARYFKNKYDHTFAVEPASDVLTPDPALGNRRAKAVVSPSQTRPPSRGQPSPV